MKQSKIFCNLELGKKLAKLKVKQDSLFYWFNLNPKIWGIYSRKDLEENTTLDIDYLIKNKEMFSSFTVGELGIKLNKIFKKNPMMDISDIDYIKLVRKAFRFEDEANVRAKMLIHLITKELIKP